MNKFMDALIANEKHVSIPESKNYWGSIIGEWELEWIVHPGTSKERCVKGEWLFSWILEGKAIQDVFICPSRKELKNKDSSNGEYGTTIRVYCEKLNCWEIFYACKDDVNRLQARKVGSEIVLTELPDARMKWIFSNIQENSFQWQNIQLDKNNQWQVIVFAKATRKLY